MKYRIPFIATPGPSHIPDEIFDSMKVNIHHRTPEFETIFRDTTIDVATFFGTKTPTLFITGSGTALMEMAISNILSPKDKIIVLEFGKFSERFREIAEAYKCDVVSISSPYGTYPDPQELQKTLSQHTDIKAVFTCHCETSTGVLAPISEYAKIISPTNVLFIVDAISSVSSVAINQDLLGIDICLGVGHKGFMIPSGLGLLSLSGKKVEQALQQSHLPKFTFDIKKERISQSKGVASWTPNIHTILGLKKSLEILLQKPLDEIISENKKIADYAHDRLQKLGLKSVVKTGFVSSPTTIAYEIDRAPEIIESMKLKGIIIANGQGILKDKIIRIGNMGCVDQTTMGWILDNLEQSIQDIKKHSS
ncbi:MAG: pyridoxal-phosphate-dependent aminotransferase family protein [Brevinema sp.]